MPECDNPLWPCAMTGAAAALAGFEGLSVVIQLKANTVLMQAIAAVLGGTEALEAATAIAPTSAEVQEIEDSQRKLLEKLEQDAQPTRVTPYYTR